MKRSKVFMRFSHFLKVVRGSLTSCSLQFAHFSAFFDATGEDLKFLFATPHYVPRSKEEKKASLDGDLRNEDLNQEGQG